MTTTFRTILLAACLGTGALGAEDPVAAPGPLDRPNILVLVIDDLGNDMVGALGEGDPLERPPTPHLDALAARSILFPNAYANPSCSPTRAAILTGRHAFRTGLGRIINPRDPFTLPFTEITIPEYLDAARSGYDHIAIGKWHLGNQATGALDPVLHGFRRFVGTESNTGDYFEWTKSYAFRDGTSGSFTSHKYLTIDQTDDALRHIHRLREPWFTWLALGSVHAPFHVPPDRLHTQTELTTDFDRYRAMVEATDNEIGRLLRELKKFRPRTVIFCLGDNGSPTEVAFTHPAKGSLFEGGVNVPFMVSGPIVAEADRGTISPALVHVMDIFSTVADLAGVDLANVLPPTRPIDSVSLLPVLADPLGAEVRSTLMCQKFLPNGFGPYDEESWMLRNERFKLIRLPGLPGAYLDQLYDLSTAPPGTDGVNVCPDPLCLGGLDAEQRAAYDELVAEFESLVASDG
jgi:arylsulfatase A-like enzyme